jgi:hypothetical protein
MLKRQESSSKRKTHLRTFDIKAERIYKPLCGAKGDIITMTTITNFVTCKKCLKIREVE